MKTLFKLLILGIVYLVSNMTQAQIVQYSEDGTQSCIDCEEKTGTDSDCFCYFFEDIPRFHEALAKIEAEKREEWLRGKEKILKGEIEDRLSTTYTSYTEAQKAFFKAYSVEWYSKSILNDLENNISATQRPKEIEKDKNYYEIRTIEKLFKYNNEGTAHKFGDLKMNGKYLKDIPNQDAVVIHTGLDNKKKEIADQLVGISRILQGIPKIRQNKALEERIINDFMNHYNGHDFLNRVLLMAKYLIWQNNGHVVGNNPANDPYPPTVFNPNAYDYPGVARDLALNAGQSASVSYPQATDDQAIASYAISTFGDNEFGFVTANPNLLNEARSYLIYHTYSKDGLDLADDLFSNYVNNNNFPHDKYNYSLDTGPLFSMDYQDAQNKNRLFNLHNHNAHQFKKFNGLGNVLSSLAQLPQGLDRDEIFIGDFVIEILKDNGTDMSSAFNGQQAFDLFHFRTYEYANLGRYDLGVDFNEFRGTTLWDNDIRFPSFLEDPIEIDAILAHEANDLPRFEYLLKLRDFANALQLDQKQKSWLVDNSDKAKNIYNYYSTLNNAGTWSSDEAIFVTNAINVMMVKPDVNPLLGADCRSFEYAQPPGALQKACAVKDFNHRFYTAGIRPNGSPYLGDITIDLDLVYFTMPTWMTNGRAANLTAKAVTDAIKFTDIYFFENPDISKHGLRDFFNNALRTELALVGGNITTQAPFTIPSPAPYLTSVWGIGTPYDCE